MRDDCWWLGNDCWLNGKVCGGVVRGGHRGFSSGGEEGRRGVCVVCGKEMTTHNTSLFSFIAFLVGSFSTFSALRWTYWMCDVFGVL